MLHDPERLLSLACAVALHTAVLCAGTSDTVVFDKGVDSTRRTNNTSIAFSLSHQQAYDWQLGEVFHLDSRCTLRYRSVWTRASLQVSAEIRGHVATLYTSHVPGTRGPIVRCTDGELSSHVTSVFPHGWIVDPYVRASVSTPITEIVPSPLHSLLRSAAWWDPVQSDQSCGFHYRISRASAHSMTLLFGTSYRQVRARHHTRGTDDPETVNSIEAYKTSLGMECLVQSDILLDSSVRISNMWQTRTSRLHVGAIQCAIDNEIRIKFWRYFGLSLCTNLRYDQTLSRRVTYKHIAQVGILWEQ
ncbi:MAG: hypothetical protein ACKOAG_13280 [Candidatus Kapaibacterium sp.]